METRRSSGEASRKRPTTPRFSSPFVDAVVAYAAANGLDAARLGLVVGPNQRPNQRVEATVDEMRTLADRVAAELGDPLLGLHVAETLPRGFYGVVEYAARSAPTLRAALAQIVRYNRLIIAHARFAIEPAPGGARFSHRVVGDAASLGRHGNEFTLAITLRQGRDLLKRAWAPERVWLAHHAPSERASLERFFGTRNIAFGAGDNALTIGDAVLDAPTPDADPALLALLDSYARTLGPSEPEGDDFVARVRGRARGMIGGGQAPSIEAVAAALRMSERTLQRRLADEGTTFAALLDEERRALARRHVAEGTMPMGEIAYVLGYSELRAFTRAFHRWTGKAPSAYRAAGVGARAGEPG